MRLCTSQFSSFRPILQHFGIVPFMITDFARFEQCYWIISLSPLHCLFVGSSLCLLLLADRIYMLALAPASYLRTHSQHKRICCCTTSLHVYEDEEVGANSKSDSPRSNLRKGEVVTLFSHPFLARLLVLRSSMFLTSYAAISNKLASGACHQLEDINFSDATGSTKR